MQASPAHLDRRLSCGTARCRSPTAARRSETGHLSANAVGYGDEKARAVLEAAAVLPVAIARAQQLVPESSRGNA